MLLGHVTDMNQLYMISDAIVLCSDAEAQPYLLLEAMAARCPVIATKVPGNELLLQNSRGLCVEPDPAAIALAIDEILSNQSTKNSCADSAYKYVNSRHRLDDQIAKLCRLYEDTVSFNRKDYTVQFNGI
jgi:glycosyltransferase involved in cell wall biosynthesis